MNKKIVLIASFMLLVAVLVTGCNKQIFDTKYTYNKAICNYNGNEFELDIRKWKDYEGEQLQIIDTKGTTYLVSANKCYLIG